MTTEKWRAIDGFEGLYYVSNFGRVKKKDPITQKEKIITPHFDPKGHITVRLRTDGKEYYLYLKNLVLEAFQDKRNRPIGFKNSDRRDCRLENLFYIENIYEQKDWNIHLGFGLWKEHPSHQGLVISDKGQVYSKGKFTKSRGGYRLKKGKILAYFEDFSGYANVGYERKFYKVHRLVMETFVGFSDLLVNHKNGVKNDNRLENLEYMSQSNNMKHAFHTGLMRRKFSKEAEFDIVTRYRQGTSIRALTKTFKACHETIKRILIDHKVSLRTYPRKTNVTSALSSQRTSHRLPFAAFSDSRSSVAPEVVCEGRGKNTNPFHICLSNPEYKQDTVSPFFSTSLEDLDGEVWKKIPGFADHYLVSNLGRIKSVARRIQERGKNKLQNRKPKIIRPSLDNGYLKVAIYSSDGKRKTFRVHRLVLKAFVGDSTLECNHIDGNKLNNCLTNLEYSTHLSNVKHANKLDLIKKRTKGSAHYTTKLNEVDVLKMLQLYQKGHTIKDIAKQFDISYTNAMHILKRKSWKHVTFASEEKGEHE